MKLSILALSIALSSTSSFATDTYKCFLDNVAYKKSPIVTVYVEKLKNGNVVTLEFTKSIYDWKPVLKVSAKDNSEDVLALYENEEKGVSLSFYMDESDMLGFADGSVKSPVMNGDVKCLSTDM